jgi:hypothetical protein
MKHSLVTRLAAASHRLPASLVFAAALAAAFVLGGTALADEQAVGEADGAGNISRISVDGAADGADIINTGVVSPDDSVERLHSFAETERVWGRCGGGGGGHITISSATEAVENSRQRKRCV